MVNQYAVRAVAIVSKGVARSAAPTDIGPHGKYFTRKDTFDISRFLTPIALKKRSDILRVKGLHERNRGSVLDNFLGLGAGAGAGAGKRGTIRNEHMPCLHELRLREVNAFSQ